MRINNQVGKQATVGQRVDLLFSVQHLEGEDSRGMAVAEGDAVRVGSDGLHRFDSQRLSFRGAQDRQPGRRFFGRLCFGLSLIATAGTGARLPQFRHGPAARRTIAPSDFDGGITVSR